MESVENLEVERYMPTIVIENTEDDDNANEDCIDKMIKKIPKPPKYFEDQGKCKNR